MQLSAESAQRIPIIRRARPWIAVIGAAIVFALIPIIGLPLFYALPLIGLALAAGSPPDYVADAKPVARRTRNLVRGIFVLILLAAFVRQPHLNLWLVELFGLEIAGLAAALVAVAALALPLAMANSATPIRDLPERRLVLTRRNLMRCLTVAAPHRRSRLRQPARRKPVPWFRLSLS